jgi:FKBP-type peptidyl-prolyl cis-trans isomerase FklB
MKQVVIFLSFIALIIISGCNSSQDKDIVNKPLDDIKKPTELIDQFSYIVGNTLGESFRKDSLYNINFEYFIAAIRAQLEGKEPLFDRREMDSIMQVMQFVFQARQESQMAKQQMESQKNKQIAYDFLESNKKKEGVVTTATGLQYKILKAGSGSSPLSNDHVKIHIKTSKIDGNIIFNSYEKNRPLMVHLNDNLLRCWFEALLKMKIGSKWIVYSPPELAFGEQGNDKVPGNTVMIYEIELLDFQLEAYPGEEQIPSSL